MEKEAPAKELLPISLKELEELLEAGWIPYDDSFDYEIKKYGIRRVIFVNPNHQE